ncbi:hypothetical protein D6D21_04450 [Aureobasidium pullulans]|uniref:Uncharacterized protein n=1 Tax=Aureobasidium pullulans TaxID=5580 RepID=A0A4S9BFB1_AURPU|nr:hypothetical protein D6D21_04450 [Aureobasidium pullulans]THW91941.1 hypothetical protein D6D15_03509 [Aureobasidium pullulans]THX30132.1 hypothetical protein D6D12_03762 [Aureobasidium pullulans]THX56927.1 hypothetical protein D6D11_03341 [Aureobasidium pullulans]
MDSSHIEDIHVRHPETIDHSPGFDFAAAESMAETNHASMSNGHMMFTNTSSRRTRAHNHVEKPSSYYRAPEIQATGKSLDRSMNQAPQNIGLGIGLDIGEWGDQSTHQSNEWDAEEMTENPRVQNYSSRSTTSVMRRRSLRVEQVPDIPRWDDPVSAVREVLMDGGLLLRAGHTGLMRVTVEQVHAVRERRRREREARDKHDRELDDYVAKREELQQRGEFTELASNDGTSEASGNQATTSTQASCVGDSDSDGDNSSSGSDSSVRTVFRLRDGNTTPRPSDTISLGKIESRPLPPIPTFPTSDPLKSAHAEDNEEFVSLNDPSIKVHIAHALESLYTGIMAAQNPMANATAPYTLGGGMPSAGHHSDMQHIWTLVQELSSVLQQNRERTDELQDGLARAQTRPAENGLLTNGDNASHAPQHAPSDVDTSAIQAQLSDALSRITELEAECKDANEVIDYAEEIVEKFKQQVQEYSRSHQSATIALHAHYNSLLETSRNETIQAQLTHQAWQASLLRLSEYLRLAQRAHEEGSLPYRRRIAALKEENRILRAKAGWEPASESEGSDDEDDVFDEGVEADSA